MNKTDAMCLAAIVLIIVAIVSALAYNWYNENYSQSEGSKEKVLVVKEGVGVKFDYTLRIRTGNDNSKNPVFATSLPSVADDDSIPKTTTFSEILGEGPLEPLGNAEKVPVREDTLKVVFGEGLYYGIMGMKEGETRTIFVDADEGVVQSNKSLVRTIPIYDTFPLYESIPKFNFESEYPNELPLKEGQTFSHNYWGWTIEIEEVNEDYILLKHDPVYGSSLDLFPWNATIDEVSSAKETFTIRHRVTDDLLQRVIDAEVLMKYNESYKEISPAQVGQEQPPLPGIIISIDEGIVIDFNKEIAGKNLIFKISMLEIEEGEIYQSAYNP